MNSRTGGSSLKEKLNILDVFLILNYSGLSEANF